MYKNVDLFFEPRKRCIQENDWPKSEPEMTDFESAFLCGLIRYKRPRKIVEVGVAGGGTTAIILKCLELLNIQDTCEVYSVDKLEKFYRGHGEPTGYLAEKSLNRKDVKFKHTFLFGKLLPEVLDEIGNDIDFVILDTEHSVPGEILDFLAVLPYLKQSACVVLHDLAANHIGRNHEAYVTQLLLSCVVADKYLNFSDDRNLGYPNIGAFDVNTETREHIADVFLCLLITWYKIKSEDVYQKYIYFYKSHYSTELTSLFEKIYHIQVNTCHKKKKKLHFVPLKSLWKYIKTHLFIF